MRQMMNNNNKFPDVKKAPFIGLHAQSVSMNELLNRGKYERSRGWNWLDHQAKKGFKPFTGKDYAGKHTGVVIQEKLDGFKAKIKGRGHTRFRVMSLFDLFAFLSIKNHEIE